jgi:hypothetical protein
MKIKTNTFKGVIMGALDIAQSNFCFVSFDWLYGPPTQFKSYGAQAGKDDFC